MKNEKHQASRRCQRDHILAFMKLTVNENALNVENSPPTEIKETIRYDNIVYAYKV